MKEMEPEEKQQQEKLILDLKRMYMYSNHYARRQFLRSLIDIVEEWESM